jgi:hypothetical protein
MVEICGLVVVDDVIWKFERHLVDTLGLLFPVKSHNSHVVGNHVRLHFLLTDHEAHKQVKVAVVRLHAADVLGPVLFHYFLVVSLKMFVSDSLVVSDDRVSLISGRRILMRVDFKPIALQYLVLASLGIPDWQVFVPMLFRLLLLLVFFYVSL